ncbi:MAG: type II secretion system major pseudopilin GspG [Planctomycetota bacterium]
MTEHHNTTPTANPNASAQGKTIANTARRGFSLIEVLIVLAIILLLSGIVGVTLFQRRDQADADITRINLNTLNSALDGFRFDFRRYPTDDEGLAVLWDREQLDPDAETSNWNGPYLREPMPNDQWGNAWEYLQESEDFDIDDEDPSAVAPYTLYSAGPDGEPDTEDDISASRSTGDNDEFGGDDLLGTDP